MYLTIHIDKHINVGNISKIVAELEPYVIDYEFDVKEFCFNILTTPMNKFIIYDVLLEHTMIVGIKVGK